MKTNSAFFLVYFFLFNSLVLALSPNEISDYKHRLSDPDPAVRLAAMSEMGSLAERSPEKAGNDVVPFFTKGLSDPDSKVRYNAVSNIALVATQTTQRFLPLKPGMIDLQSYAPLKAILEKMLFDPDAEIRQNALIAYDNLFDLTPEMQAQLITQYTNEGEGGNQELIITSLAASESPTNSTVNFLLHLLDDHRYANRIAMTWAGVKGTPPQAALPKLVDLLSKTSNRYDRQAFVSAIGKYGEQARPYLGQIEKLRDKETDATTQANLSRAAEAIRAGKPLQQ